MKRLRDRGLWNCMSYSLYRIDDEYQFWKFGIRSEMCTTMGEGKTAKELGLPSDDCHPYWATQSYRAFRTIMNRYIRPSENDVFLDYGSGRGRVVFMAATLPFRRVIGVEYNHELHSAAARTWERIRSKLPCKDVQLVQCDASVYELPRDVTVIYFFSPFGGSVLANVIDRIRLSLLESPRNLRIVFQVPGKFEHVIDGCDWIVKRTQIVFPAVSNDRYGIYESVNPSGSAKNGGG